jgi:hypothetical protein
MGLVSFTYRPLYPRKNRPGTYSVEGWVDARVRLDSMEKKKVLSLPGMEPDPPARSRSLYGLSYSDIVNEGHFLNS